MHSAMFKLSPLACFIQISSLFSLAFGASVLPEPRSISTSSSNLSSRKAGSGPIMVIYTDDYLPKETNNLPQPAGLEGYNVLILAFLLNEKAADQAQVWAGLSDAKRAAQLKKYHDAGIKVMVSSFGSTEQPTTKGLDPVATGKRHAAWVKKYDLDGIDVDYEDMTAMNKHNGKAEAWLISYTKALRSALPAGQYYISHAPVAPWFSKAAYNGGAYYKVNAEVGDLIDFYNIQFYNQGSKLYTDCNTLIHTSGGGFSKTSLLEIIADGGVATHKAILGKPSAKYQADNGWMEPASLAKCISQAVSKGWSGGVMFWEYETNKNQGANLVKGLSALLGGVSNIPIDGPGGGDDGGDGDNTSSTKSYSKSASAHGSKTKTHSPTPTPQKGHTNNVEKPKSGDDTSNNSTTTSSCSGIPAWNAETIYDGGSQVTDGHKVSYKGVIYENKWWTQGNEPGPSDDSDPWVKVGSCEGSSKKRMHRKRRMVHDSSS